MRARDEVEEEEEEAEERVDIVVAFRRCLLRLTDAASECERVKKAKGPPSRSEPLWCAAACPGEQSDARGCLHESKQPAAFVPVDRGETRGEK